MRQTTFWESELKINPELFEKHIEEYVASCMKLALCETYSKDTVGNCPLCGSLVIEQKFLFSCIRWKEQVPCSFKIWKTFHNASIIADDAKVLLSGLETKTKNCKSKDGKVYKAKFHMNKDGTLEQIFVRSRAKNMG